MSSPSLASAWLTAGAAPTEGLVRTVLAAALADAIAKSSERVAREVVDVRAKDAKSVLQEHAQRDGGAPPVYELEGTDGPVHDRSFRVRVTVRGVLLGRGEGRSRREAEMKAAVDALEAGARDPAVLDARGGSGA